MIVHQLLSGAGPHDAITTEARTFRTWFRRWGWGGSDHAFRMAPGLDGDIVTAERLRAAPDDVLLLHHSAGWPRLGELLALPNPKLLLYHNVTPPHLLWDHAPIVAAHCAAGREQLPELVSAVDVAAADSAYNATELAALGATRTEVIHLLVELGRLGMPTPGDGSPSGPPTLLFVGRLSPHKHQDELIRILGLLRRYRQPDARLMLVGDPISEPYLEHLHALARRLAPGAVTIESSLDPEALGERYRAADVFVCRSEHEGFCIPLLEAMYFGVPVVARPVGAVPEVLGDAGLLLDDPDPAVTSETIQLVLEDAGLAGELRARGRVRLTAFSPEAIAARLRQAVESTVAAASPDRPPGFRSA